MIARQPLTSMEKFVLVLPNGEFVKHVDASTKDLEEAWTFNKPTGAIGWTKINGIKDFDILPVVLDFTVRPTKTELVCPCQSCSNERLITCQ